MWCVARVYVPICVSVPSSVRADSDEVFVERTLPFDEAWVKKLGSPYRRYDLCESECG